MSDKSEQVIKEMELVSIGHIAFKDDVVYCEGNGDMDTWFEAMKIYPFFEDRKRTYMMIDDNGVAREVEDANVDLEYIHYNNGTIFVTPLDNIDADNGKHRFLSGYRYRVREEMENGYWLYDENDLFALIPKHLFTISTISGFDFRVYQLETRKTAIYKKAHELEYLGFGLVGEAGELANKLKKIFRDNDGELTLEKIAEIEGEIGDILWYCSQMSSYINRQFENIALANLSKLRARQSKGTLKGSGDNR